ncbi:GntR family transcriptional regulator [Streptomyces sp. ACA25]|uniref:GntR family transcriptional regulator n=1 Tax=Streptomyces sp. ACA25 TaxID=3022596 RepID=UPI002307D11A|nr:GntR family transcriptional regulator [Streptomyces sp. ACA25]MDB1089417.1 GntR family transcriptional regulator [Streptomyces sp. ACA25]
MATTQPAPVQEPKYRHLKTVLSEALDSDFAVGQILPNERDLAARFGVARATLRQALEQLELEGRLQRRRGVGTTVAPPRIGVDVSPGRHTWPGAPGDSWITTDCRCAPPPPEVARMLQLRPDERVQVVHRTRTTHGQPVAIEQLHFPAASLAGDPPHDPGADGADRGRHLLRLLQRSELGGQDRAVELGSARADVARQLDRLPGAPVLVVTTRYLARDRTVAVGVATFRADTCRLTFGTEAPVPLPAD